MIAVIIMLIVGFILLITMACLAVSGNISRQEEMREMIERILSEEKENENKSEESDS